MRWWWGRTRWWTSPCSNFRPVSLTIANGHGKTVETTRFASMVSERRGRLIRRYYGALVFPMSATARTTLSGSASAANMKLDAFMIRSTSAAVGKGIRTALCHSRRRTDTISIRTGCGPSKSQREAADVSEHE